MTLILTLYQSILIPIFEDWISDEDLCCLDVAACNRNLRVNFLKVITMCNIGYVYYDRSKFYYWHMWMVLRGIHTRSISVRAAKLSHFDSILPVNKRLKVLEAIVRISLCDFLANVTEVEMLILFSHETTNEAVETILRTRCPSKCLNISKCKGLTPKIMPTIIHLVSKLESVVIPLYLARHAVEWLKNNMKDYDETSSYLQNIAVRCEVDGSLEVRANRARVLSLHLGKGNNCSTVKTWAKFPCLEKFATCETSLADAIYFSNRLTSLTIRRDVNEKELLHCLKNFKLLKSIEINRDLTDATLFHLAKYCPELEDLTAYGDNMSDFGVMKVLEGCKKLVHVTLVDHVISEEVLQFVVKGSTMLKLESDKIWVKHDNKRKGLTLQPLMDLDARMLCSLLQQCPGLQTVRLDHCSICDYVIESLVDYCRVLHTVELTDCLVTNDVIVSLAKCIHLKRLTVSDLDYISDELIDSFMLTKSDDFKLYLPRCSGVNGLWSGKYDDFAKYDIDKEEKYEESDEDDSDG